MSIKRESATEQVASALRAGILSGQILPGTFLREVVLAEELQVSRNTVREAGRLLGAEGLVHHQMNRGIVVADISFEDLEDIYAARAAVETAGVDALMATMDPAIFAKLHDFVDQLETAVENRDTSAGLDGDRQFHATLVSATGSVRLERFYTQLQQELRLVLSLAEQSSHELGRTKDDHRELLDALESGGAAEAHACLRQHLQRGEVELQRLRTLLHQSQAAEPDRGAANLG